jgi:hypothetical protein
MTERFSLLESLEPCWTEGEGGFLKDETSATNYLLR